MRKMEPRTTCRQCQQEIHITWVSGSIRCQFCYAITPLLRGHELDQAKCFYRKEHQSSKMDKSGGSSSGTSLNAEPSPTETALASSETRPTKRALLCGVTYRKQKYELKGTIIDVKFMRELLMEQYHFPMNCIRILTEDETNPDLIPTRKNMEESLQWLVKGCLQPGDSLVFYFSGHGLRQPEFEGDEIDHFDETICPVDFTKEGMILDNDINYTIVRPLPNGVTLHALVDACHSGTILDLEHVYSYKDHKWVDNSPPSGAFKGTSGGLAISLSACGDSEMAADTNAFSKNKRGAMTSTLIKAVYRNPDLTYGQLLASMREDIEEANKANWLNSRLLKRLFHSRLLREPQLSSSQTFDVNKTKFKL